ncbi:MAG: restriction endonuclease subunit S [Eubacteriales bacterium]|nr:restriction endonuclease subunit S [Eubacteriales bacterium]
MADTKPSGITWIGNIPPDWEMKKIKYISTLKGRIGWQGLTSDEYTDEGAYLITGTDFDNGGINWDTCVHVPMKRWEEAKDIQIVNGDLLITKDGTIGKVAIVDGLNSPCSLNSGVLRISTINGYDRRFLFWVLQSEVFWTWYSNKTAGNSTILHLYQGDFAEFNYAVPPLPEQQAIAAFLDDCCGKVDEIITDSEKQVEILHQYKKALITETVTGGLDKSAPMKDSGIDIVGDIVATWGMKRLKYLSNIQTGSQDTQDAIEDGEYPFYVRSPIVERINKYDFDGEAILMAGDGVGAGKVFHFANGKFGCHQRVYIIHNFKHVNAKFLFYFLSNFFSVEIEKGSAKSTVDSIRLPMLQNFFVCIPSLSEQTAIVTYLDQRCAEIDDIIAEKERSIETMRQYKKSLIYEYVTGKKRVVS